MGAFCSHYLYPDALVEAFLSKTERERKVDGRKQYGLKRDLGNTSVGTFECDSCDKITGNSFSTTASR